MYIAPLRLSDFSRNKLDPKDARKRTFAALEKFRKAQEALEKTCLELGIPVPVMICNAAKKAEIPESLVQHVTIELGLLEIKRRAVNSELAIEVEKILKKMFETKMQAEWLGYNPHINLAHINKVPTLDIYFGGKRLITLQ